MNRPAYLIVAAAVAVVVLVVGALLQYTGGDDETKAAATVAPGASVQAEGSVSVDGKPEDLKGTCQATADGRTLNISLSGPTTRLNIGLDNAVPPKVSSVVLAKQTMAFVYQPGQEGTVEARREGDDYRISGTLLRYGFVSTQFDATATCG